MGENLFNAPITLDEALRIHGCNWSFSSDSGLSELDQQFYAMQPPIVSYEDIKDRICSVRSPTSTTVHKTSSLQSAEENPKFNKASTDLSPLSIKSKKRTKYRKKKRNFSTKTQDCPSSPHFNKQKRPRRELSKSPKKSNKNNKPAEKSKNNYDRNFKNKSLKKNSSSSLPLYILDDYCKSTQVEIEKIESFSSPEENPWKSSNTDSESQYNRLKSDINAYQVDFEEISSSDECSSSTKLNYEKPRTKTKPTFNQRGSNGTNFWPTRILPELKGKTSSAKNSSVAIKVHRAPASAPSISSSKNTLLQLFRKPTSGQLVSTSQSHNLSPRSREFVDEGQILFFAESAKCKNSNLNTNANSSGIDFHGCKSTDLKPNPNVNINHDIKNKSAIISNAIKNLNFEQQDIKNNTCINLHEQQKFEAAYKEESASSNLINSSDITPIIHFSKSSDHKTTKTELENELCIDFNDARHGSISSANKKKSKFEFITVDNNSSRKNIDILENKLVEKSSTPRFKDVCTAGSNEKTSSFMQLKETTSSYRYSKSEDMRKTSNFEFITTNDTSSQNMETSSSSNTSNTKTVKSAEFHERSNNKSKETLRNFTPPSSKESHSFTKRSNIQYINVKNSRSEVVKDTAKNCGSKKSIEGCGKTTTKLSDINKTCMEYSNTSINKPSNIQERSNMELINKRVSTNANFKVPSMVYIDAKKNSSTKRADLQEKPNMKCTDIQKSLSMELNENFNFNFGKNNVSAVIDLIGSKSKGMQEHSGWIRVESNRTSPHNTQYSSLQESACVSECYPINSTESVKVNEEPSFEIINIKSAKLVDSGDSEEALGISSAFSSSQISSEVKEKSSFDVFKVKSTKSANIDRKPNWELQDVKNTKSENLARKAISKSAGVKISSHLFSHPKTVPVKEKSHFEKFIGAIGTVSNKLSDLKEQTNNFGRKKSSSAPSKSKSEFMTEVSSMENNDKQNFDEFIINGNISSKYTEAKESTCNKFQNAMRINPVLNEVKSANLRAEESCRSIDLKENYSSLSSTHVSGMKQISNEFTDIKDIDCSGISLHMEDDFSAIDYSMFIDKESVPSFEIIDLKGSLSTIYETSPAVSTMKFLNIKEPLSRKSLNTMEKSSDQFPSTRQESLIFDNFCESKQYTSVNELFLANSKETSKTSSKASISIKDVKSGKCCVNESFATCQKKFEFAKVAECAEVKENSNIQRIPSYQTIRETSSSKASLNSNKQSKSEKSLNSKDIIKLNLEDIEDIECIDGSGDYNSKKVSFTPEILSPRINTNLIEADSLRESTPRPRYFTIADDSIQEKFSTCLSVSKTICNKEINAPYSSNTLSLKAGKSNMLETIAPIIHKPNAGTTQVLTILPNEVMNNFEILFYHPSNCSSNSTIGGPSDSPLNTSTNRSDQVSCECDCTNEQLCVFCLEEPHMINSEKKYQVQIQTVPSEKCSRGDYEHSGSNIKIKELDTEEEASDLIRDIDETQTCCFLCNITITKFLNRLLCRHVDTI